MAIITTLPDECILHILSFLRPTQILSLALTLNKRLYQIALPLLQPLLKARRNEARLINLFQCNPRHNGGWLKTRFDDRLRAFGLEGPSDASDAFSRYLEQHDSKLGDLNWLSDYADTCHSCYLEDSKSTVTSHELDSLIYTTNLLGLTLPNGLEKLLRDPRLYKCVPSDQAWYFTLGPLTKFKMWAGRNGSVGLGFGYIIRFYSDQQGCAYRHLYLDTKGGHAVIFSGSLLQMDPEDGSDSDEYHNTGRPGLSDLERKLGVRELGSWGIIDMEMESTGFEKFLFDYVEKQSC